MGYYLVYKSLKHDMSTSAFGSLIIYTLKVAEEAASPEELQFVARMRHTMQIPWIDLEKDMPSVTEQKFWCKMFFETARAIFERKVGSHGQIYWQARMIYLAYGTGIFFQRVVQDQEQRWEPSTVDTREFNRIVNKIEG